MLTPVGVPVAGEAFTVDFPAGGPYTSAIVNWGDGTVDTLASPNNMTSDTHTYAAAGDYLVQAFLKSSAGTFCAMLDNDLTPSQDPGFGSSTGTVSDQPGGISSLAVQPDGSIVALDSNAAVSAASGGSTSPLVRFDSTGQPDGTTFDDVSSIIPTLTNVAVQPVPGGFAVLAAGSGWQVARFNSDGSLDASFGGDGIASLPLPPGEGWGEGGQNLPSSLLVEPDGEIVLAGIEPDPNIPGDTDVVLAYFTPSGQPDTAFGANENGILTHDLGAAATSCSAALQPGGNVVVAVGFSAGGSEVLQFGPNGQNMGFGDAGAISVAVADPLLAVQPDGEIDLAGNADSSHYVLQQYTANGATLDWNTGAQLGQVGAMAVQPSGRIVDAVLTGANAWSLQGFFPANGAADTAFDELGQISAMTGAPPRWPCSPTATSCLPARRRATPSSRGTAPTARPPPSPSRTRQSAIFP